MAERFEKLFSLPSNLYSEGSPIIISAGSLLKDTETGKVIVQIKYHSVSDIPIKALKLNVAAYDISGAELERIDGYQYLDLNIQNGQDFGSNKAIVLPNVVTRSFNITSIMVVLSDGTTQPVVMPMRALSKSATLSSLLKNDELVKQYQIETSKEAVFIPKKEANLWCCACGEWNSNDNCTRCGLNFTTAYKFLDSSLLEPKSEERIIKEKQYREQQRRIAEEQERVAKENEKKKKKKTTIFALVAIVTIAIISGLLYYTSQHKYDEIAGVYALQNLEDAEEALYEFQEDSIDEYGFNPYSYEIEIKGSGKVYGLWFVNDKGSMTPRAATVKSVSENGVVEFDVLDYPNAKVTLTIDTETGEATYSSRSLELDYHRITEELANNGYKECSAEDVGNELSFVQDLFALKSVEAICDKYPAATTEGAKHDVKIDGSFCGATGTYEIWLDGVWRINFTQGIYDTNTEKQDLIDNLNRVLGEGDYSESLDAYYWTSSEYNLEIDYWPHEGVYFFLDEDKADTTDAEYDEYLTWYNVEFASSFLGKELNADGSLSMGPGDYEALSNDMYLFDIPGRFSHGWSSADANPVVIDILDWVTTKSIDDFNKIINPLIERYGDDYRVQHYNDAAGDAYMWKSVEMYEYVICWQNTDGTVDIRWTCSGSKEFNSNNSNLDENLKADADKMKEYASYIKGAASNVLRDYPNFEDDGDTYYQCEDQLFGITGHYKFEYFEGQISSVRFTWVPSDWRADEGYVVGCLTECFGYYIESAELLDDEWICYVWENVTDDNINVSYYIAEDEGEILIRVK